MTIASLRKLGQFGVITDVDPFDLPLGTFTMSLNARFEDSRISRGPVFNSGGALSNTSPQYAVSYKVLGGTNSFIICNLDGTIQSWTPGSAQTTLTAPGWTPATYNQPVTGCVVNNLVYLNRPDRQPWFMQKGGAAFAVLPVWTSSWRCQAMRSFNGQIVALNVTQAGIQYPTMVAWSDFTVWNATPGYWTAAPTNSAGSNVLSDMADPLIDGMALRNNFMLYSQMETWGMTPTGDNSVFSFQRLFDNGWGMISQNCGAEVNNQHYVLGLDKVWKHDGFTPQDICSGRVKSFIYNNMVKADASQFFTVHQPRNNEVMFCYRSTDPFCYFPIQGTNNYQGCNRAAVFNYRSEAWYFYDLPYVTSAGFSSPQPGATYLDESSTSFASIGGSYSTYGDASKLCLYMTINGTSGAAAIDSYELPNSVYASGLIDAPRTAPVSLQISQVNLDELGAKLRGYKVLKSIYPEGRIDPGAPPLMFNFGSSDYTNDPKPMDGTAMSFDGSSLYKLDYMAAGRFLSMKVTFNDYRNFTLSGLDADFEITGNR
jgi:hypothetical protein